MLSVLQWCEDMSETDSGYDKAVDEPEKPVKKKRASQGPRQFTGGVGGPRNPGKYACPVGVDGSDWTPKKYHKMNERFVRAMQKAIEKGLEHVKS